MRVSGRVRALTDIAAHHYRAQPTTTIQRIGRVFATLMSGRTRQESLRLGRRQYLSIVFCYRARGAEFYVTLWL